VEPQPMKKSEENENVNALIDLMEKAEIQGT
jgi:hypothetical protein